MPGWLIRVFAILGGIALIFFCGWLGESLHLKNWHIALFFGAGLAAIAAGSAFGFIPAVLIGFILFLFACFTWGYRGMIALLRKRQPR